MYGNLLQDPPGSGTPSNSAGIGNPFAGAWTPGVTPNPGNPSSWAWAGLDFGGGGSEVLGMVEIDPVDGEFSNAPTQFEVQFSSDGTNWATGRVFTNIEWNNNSTRFFPVPQKSIDKMRRQVEEDYPQFLE